jgi:hypothetical protein
VVNSGEQELTNVEMHCEIGGIKRDVFLDILPNDKTTTVINYTDQSGGFKKGKISVNDKQLYWDDEYFFSYFVDNSTNVLVINGESAVNAVSQVYQLEKFYVHTTIDQNSFTLDDLKQKDLVFLNGVNEIPSGMAENLKNYAQTGGTLALFPGNKCETGSWNLLLKDLGLPGLGRIMTAGTKIDKLIYDDPFFFGMFEKKKENLNLPSVSKVYQSSAGGKNNAYELIRLQNGMPLFLRTGGSINAFLFTSSLSSDFGTFTSDALFPSIVLRIGEMSQRKTPISLTIGKESFFPLYRKVENETPIHLRSGKIDFIPQLRKQGLISYISLGGQEALENLKAGTYDVDDETKEAVLSLNYDRTESNIDVYEQDEIVSSLENEGLKNVSFSAITDGQSLTKIDIHKPFEYWKLFILLGLIFFLSELMVLKFWK